MSTDGTCHPDRSDRSGSDDSVSATEVANLILVNQPAQIAGTMPVEFSKDLRNPQMPNSGRVIWKMG